MTPALSFVLAPLGRLEDRLRNLVDMDGAIVAEIDARLETCARAEGVDILLAVESGSRAWGFPSPDSDYDCRFLYARPMRDYLALWPRRDVIETPVDSVFDVNGWDLAKAVRLLVKGNAVVIEWLTSPLVYRGKSWFRDAMLDLARAAASRDLVARHYLHLGLGQRQRYVGENKEAPAKKIFYVLRPALALRWLRLRPQAVVAPMRLQTLLEECETPPDLRACVEELVARKRISREMGVAFTPKPIMELIEAEFSSARTTYPEQAEPRADVREAAQAAFEAILTRAGDERPLLNGAHGV